MTLAAERLAALARWLDKSSTSYPSPCSSGRPVSRTFFGKAIPNPVETVVVGRYAEILPWDFDALPTSDFDPQALPLFVSQSQAEALNLPPVADLSPPSVSQGRAADRLHMVVGKMEDATMRFDPAWRTPDGWQDRLCAIVGIPSPDMTLAAAVDAAGASGVDLDAFPLLVVPTWAMARKEVACLRLPFIPT